MSDIVVADAAEYPEFAVPEYNKTFADWTEAKPKYFLELISNVSNVASLVFTRISETFREGFENLSGFARGIKAFFGMPAAAKGAVSIAKDLSSGKKPLSSNFISVGFFLSDAGDAFKAFANAQIINVSNAMKSAVAVIKNLGAIIGLSLDICDQTEKLNELDKADAKNLPEGVQDKPKAEYIKAKWIKAETDSLWWNRERNIMGLALCCLGMIFPNPVSWGLIITFTALNVLSITGKMAMFCKAQEASYWKNRQAEEINLPA